MFLHGFTHFKGRVYANTVVAVQHFGIHSTHGSADNKVGLFLLYLLSQKVNSLGRVQRKVVGDDRCRGESLRN